MPDALGLERTTVALRLYDERWAKLFQEERARLQGVLSDDVLAIEHIGSTAVPGLTAKPILDVGVAVADFEAAFALVPRLEGLGYTFRGEQGIPRRHYFVQGADTKRTHHLHMLEHTNPEWRDLLGFRDRLRAQPETAKAYETLKRQLAKEHPNDREAYTNGKVEFVRAVLDRA